MDLSHHALDRLVGWARAHPTDFYCKILPRVLPKQMELGGPEGGDIPHSIKVRFVSPAKKL